MPFTKKSFLILAAAVAIFCVFVMFFIGMVNFLLITAVENSDIKLTTGCLRFGANPNALDNFHITPLMISVDASQKQINLIIVRTLIARGANVNDQDELGDTPLHYAVRIPNNPTVVRLLLENGSKPNVKNHGGDTPLLEIADNSKAYEVIKVLVNGGADTHLKGRDGKSALDIARMSHNIVALRLFASKSSK